MNLRLLAVLLAAIFLSMLAASVRAGDPPKLAGMTFVSKEKMEAGRGGATANWRLTFQEAKVSWRYSDVSETFDYTIDADGKIAASSKMRNGAVHTAQYDAEKKELTWEGKVYVPQ